jgi:hypothetical protein
VVVPNIGAPAPIASFSVQTVNKETLVDFSIQYGQYLLVALVGLVCVGVCCGNMAITSELGELIQPNKFEYKRHLKEYVVVGNEWDPEDEQNTRQRLNLSEGGEPEVGLDPTNQLAGFAGLPDDDYSESGYSKSR